MAMLLCLLSLYAWIVHQRCYYAAAGHESLKIIIFNHTILLLNALNGLHQLHRGTGVRFDFLKYYYYYYYYAIVHVVQT